MKNSVIKKVDGKDVGFFFGTKASLDFSKEFGKSMTEIDIEKHDDVLRAYCVVLMVSANEYNRKNGSDHKYTFEDACDMCDSLGLAEVTEIIMELREEPEIKAKETEGKH